MRRTDTDDTPEERIDERQDETTYLPSVGGGITAWAPGLDTGERRPDDPALRDEAAGDTPAGVRGDGGSWWDEGLITTLIVAGAVLFVIPEPATTGLGILLLSLGALAWLVDLVT